MNFFHFKLKKFHLDFFKKWQKITKKWPFLHKNGAKLHIFIVFSQKRFIDIFMLNNRKESIKNGKFY